jgi:hypothetical protein
MRTRGTSGQSSVEYIAIVAIVALVFAIAGGFTLQGRAIAAATVGQLKRGLCIVEGHDCKEEHPPCPVASRSGTEDIHVDIAFVHVGSGKSAIVERNSDGRVFVTVANHHDLGLTTGIGVGLKIRDKLAIGGEVRAEALASLGTGKTYEVASEGKADALLAALRRGEERGLPAPVSKYVDASLGGHASGTLKGVDLSGGAAIGGRLDTVTGKRTIYLQATGSFDRERTGPAGPSASGGGSGDVRLALTLDRHNKPIDLMAIGAGELHASADLPPLLSPVAGHLPTGLGRSWEVEAHLDLSQPGRTSAVLADLSHPSRLLDMVLNDGSVQARGYATNDDTDEISGHIKAGAVIGGGISRTQSSRRLIAAMEHTPEGFWVPRYDCLAAASA